MTKVEIKYLPNLGTWYASDGNQWTHGTKDDCVSWLAKRYTDAREKAERIADVLLSEGYEESPYALAAGE